MFVAWVVFHVIVCVSLILVVLMQSSKGEGLAGSAFGGGALSGAVFGGRGAATFLQKATTVLAIVFMLNCGALAFMSSNRSGRTTTTNEVTESAVTRQAQKDMEEAMQRQQQQQQLAQPVDTGTGINLKQEKSTPTHPPTETPDQSGGK